jgi:hypothetical protein
MTPPLGKWGEDETNAISELKSRVVAGAAAGNITVDGINPGDKIVTVINLSAAGANLASQFRPTAIDTINNTGGTVTTGMLLLVQWVPAATQRTGYAQQ